MSFSPVRLDGGGCGNVLLWLPGPGLLVCGSDTQGYYVSANKALTWTVQNTGIGVSPFWRQSAALFASVTETSPQVVYSLTGEQGSGGGLLAGTLDPAGNITWAMRSAVPQGAANHCAAPLPTDGWKRSTGRLLHQDSLYLYAGTYNQGILRSSNTGGSGSAGAGTPGLCGSTTTVNIYPGTPTHLLAAQAADAIYGTTMAQSCQKLYFNPLPSSAYQDGQGTVLPLISGGARYWLCVQPAKDGSDVSALQTALQWWLDNWPNPPGGTSAQKLADAQAHLKVVLYQECQDHFPGTGPTSGPGGYLAVCNAYVPMIHSLGLANVYDAAGFQGLAKFQSWYPLNPGVTPGSAADNLCDELSVDMYGTNWVSQGGSATFNPLQAYSDFADAHNKPFGVAEIGSGVAVAPVTITQANWILYITAIKNMMVSRMLAGKANSDVMWYSADHDAAILNSVQGPSTTIAAGSAGGKISNIATWGSPSPGLLKVASTTGFGTANRAGPLWVQCNDGTVARISYHQAITDGTTFGTALTGCTYIDGSPNGTVSAGNLVAVWQFDNGQAADFRVTPVNYIKQLHDAITVAPGGGLPGQDGFPVACTMAGAAPGTGTWFCRALAPDPASSTTLWAGFYQNVSGTASPAGLWKCANAHATAPNFIQVTATGGPAAVEDIFPLGDYLYVAGANDGVFRYGPLSGTPAWANLNGGTIPTGTTTGDWWSNAAGWADGSGNHVIIAGNSNPTLGAQCLMRLVIPAAWPGSGSITYSNETAAVTSATEPPGYTWWHAGGSYKNWLGQTGFFCPFTLADASNLAAVNLYCTGSQGASRNLAGAGWQIASSGQPMFLGHAVAASPSRPGHAVYNSSDWCMFDDTAPGAETAATLANNPPVSGTQGQAQAFSADGNTVYASQGAKYTNSGGEAWSRPWNAPAAWAPMGLGARTGGKVAIGLAAFTDDTGAQAVLAAVWGSGMWRWDGTAWSNRSPAILATLNSGGGTTGNQCPVTYYGGGLAYCFDRLKGIWRSSDYGRSWTLIWAKTTSDNLSGTAAYDVTRPGRLWVSAGGKLYQLGGADTGTVAGGGITGAGADVTPPGVTAGPLGTSGAGDIYLAAQDTGTGAGLLGTSDDGATWADITGGDGSFARCNANPEFIAAGPPEAAAGAPRLYVSGSNVVATGYPAGSAAAGVSAPFTELQSNANLLGTGGVLSMWFGAGGQGSTRGSLLIARVEASDGTATITPSDPGWQLAIDVPAAPGSPTARAQIWWYPNNPGGIGGQGSAQILTRPAHRVTPAAAAAGVLAGGAVAASGQRAAARIQVQAPQVIAGTVVPAATATFTCSNPGATIRGRLAEYSSGAGTIQYLDRTGAGSGTSAATSLPVAATAANTCTGGLATVLFGAQWSVQPSGQSWATPAGWASDGVTSNVNLIFAAYYQAGLVAGPTSVTGTISPGTGGTMTAWAAALATFYALAASPVSITTSSLPGGTAGGAYGPVTLNVSGGSPPYAFAVTNGALPGGLSLDPAAGAVTGTPAATGSFSFTVTVTDSAAQTATAAFTIVIADALAITTASLPDGTLGQPYTAQLQVTGGTPPYAWTVTGGSLPPGLALDGRSGPPAGSLAGAPLLPGTFTFTTRVTDSRAAAASAALSITVRGAAPLTILTASLPPGKLGQPYTAAFTATGGTPPYHWALSSGTLPPGLALNDDGTVTGTLLASGAYRFTVTVTDT